jgi:hypothetical protein
MWKMTAYLPFQPKVGAFGKNRKADIVMFMEKDHISNVKLRA